MNDKLFDMIQKQINKYMQDLHTDTHSVLFFCCLLLTETVDRPCWYSSLNREQDTNKKLLLLLCVVLKLGDHDPLPAGRRAGGVGVFLQLQKFRPPPSQEVTSLLVNGK